MFSDSTSYNNEKFLKIFYFCLSEIHAVLTFINFLPVTADPMYVIEIFNRQR